MADRFKNLLKRLLDKELAARIGAIEDDIVTLKAFVLLRYSIAAYAEMGIVTPPIAFSDLTPLAWTNVGVYEAEPFTSRGITMIPATGFFSVNEDSIYRVSFGGAISHNEVNASREMEFRLFNVPDGAPVGTSTFFFGTARNQAVTNMDVTFLVEVGDLEKDKDFVVQVAGALGSTYTSVAFEDCTLSVNAVGEWRDVIS